MAKAPMDVSGWLDLTWGLALDSVVQKLGSDNVGIPEPPLKSGDLEAKLAMHHIDVGSYAYQPILFFDLKSQLQMVQLVHDCNEEKSPSIERKDLQKILERRYGKSSIIGYGPDFYWKFPTTTILVHTHSWREKFGGGKYEHSRYQIFLSYSPSKD